MSSSGPKPIPCGCGNHNLSPPPEQCSLCKTWFRRACAKKVMIYVKNDESKFVPYACNVCVKKYKEEKKEFPDLVPEEKKEIPDLVTEDTITTTINALYRIRSALRTL
jgi:hypothetical protein